MVYIFPSSYFSIAGEAGISPVLWAMSVSFGVCLLLLPVLVVRRHLQFPKGKMIRFVILSALISFVLPNLLLFSVIPHAGAGYTGLMFALSPVFTLSFAALFRLKTTNRTGLAGIAIGLFGAFIISITRGSAPEAPALVWILAALIIPVALSVGNIYRTLDWPEAASPDSLAFWSHAFSVFIFISILLITKGSVPVLEFGLAPLAVTTQILVAGILFPVFFRLQQQGGPVLLSQIGYVAAAVGLIAATVFMGEQYNSMTWVGAAIIGLGIFFTIRAETSMN